MNCDPIARWYRCFEYIGFGRALEKRRCAFLHDVAYARRGLVLGEGDGRFLFELVEQNPEASIDYVDLSGRMMELARNRVGDRVRYFQADARTFPLPEAEYDLIVTNFFLDCFDERDQNALVARVSHAARGDAHWLISEFREPATWARWFVRTLYLFFRMTTGLQTSRLSDHRPLLEKCGFRMAKEERSRFGLLASELWVRQNPIRRQ